MINRYKMTLRDGFVLGFLCIELSKLAFVDLEGLHCFRDFDC